MSVRATVDLLLQCRTGHHWHRPYPQQQRRQRSKGRAGQLSTHHSNNDDDNPLEGRGAMVDALAMMETIAMHHGRRCCAYRNYAWRRRSSWCGRCTLPCRLIGDATAVEGGRRRYAFGVKVASMMVVVTATLAFNDM